MLRILSLAAVLAALSACGGHSKHADEGFANVEPAVADAPYADVLKTCATGGISCTLATLPPIGMENPVPSVDEVMERVLVSHPWMAERFRELLEALPEDVRILMQAVTAVVIDDDIRPAFYTSQTGAIYLDPHYLWQTPDERAVINPAPDYRAVYAQPMAFRAFHRYVEDGRVEAGLGNGDNHRTFEEILPDAAALLFHELAHANDIFPPAVYDTVDLSQTMEAVTSSLNEQQLSTQLWVDARPASQEMLRLSAILYRGETPTPAEMQLTAAEVGSWFAMDITNDDYAYTSQYEDLAMLFEEAMMKLHLGLDRDMAFVSAPAAGGSCNDYRVGWGQRNRIGQNDVKARAQWVTEALLPERDYSEFFAALPEPQSLRLNAGWCDSVTLDQAAFIQSEQPSVEQRAVPYHHMLRGGVAQ